MFQLQLLQPDIDYRSLNKCRSHHNNLDEDSEIEELNINEEVLEDSMTHVQ